MFVAVLSAASPSTPPSRAASSHIVFVCTIASTVSTYDPSLDFLSRIGIAQPKDDM